MTDPAGVDDSGGGMPEANGTVGSGNGFGDFLGDMGRSASQGVSDILGGIGQGLGGFGSLQGGFGLSAPGGLSTTTGGVSAGSDAGGGGGYGGIWVPPPHDGTQ